MSRVTKTNGMFYKLTSFHADISTWDVSRVTDMSHMFASANFNGDISTWDVSKVTNMNRVFMSATSFKQRLCGAAWVHSKAIKKYMFRGLLWINIAKCVSQITI